MGGQQPLENSAVQLYAAGSDGYGTGAQALTSAVYTGSDGGFSITDSYTCPTANPLTYLVATGGEPGTGVNNPAITLMAVLGSCNDLSSISFITIDEVTTIASAWALAPFLGSGAQVGTSSGNQQGLVNAFANVNNLVDLSTGTAPGTAAPQGAVIPISKIDTLANIVAACVNSPGSDTCGKLFADATPSTGIAPSNTLDAALNIARNPSANVAALYRIPLPSPPFQPTLGTAPPDWTLAVSYVEGGLCPYESVEIGCEPGSIAVDASGNVWAANYWSSVTELSNTGHLLSPGGGFTGGGLNESYGIAVGENGSVWVTNEVTPGVNNGLGSLTVLNSLGQVNSPTGGYFGGGVDFPVGIATDTDGSVWTANYGDSTASRLSSTGSAISGGTGFGVNQLVGPVAVAIDANHYAWLANQSADSGSVTSISPNGAQVTTIASGGDETSGIATDSIGMTGSVSGHVWTANYSSNSVSELELGTGGSAVVISTGYTGGGLSGPNSIAVDGAGNIWVTSFIGDTISELQGAAGANPGQVLSPGGGFGQDAKLERPYGIAIDASGNVWVSNFGSSTITQFLGAATPVQTPLTGPAQLP